MAVVEEIVASLRAEGQAAFRRAMDQSAQATERVGQAAEKSGQQVKQGGQEAGRATPKWQTVGKKVAGWAGGAAALYGASRGIQASVSATSDLAKSTMAVQRATGLDAKQASAWATITKARGIQTNQLGIGFTALSRQIAGAQNGSKKAVATFNQLGVSQDALAKGDVQSVIFQTADAFERMTDPAQKAALAQQLFGRQGRNLLPLLNSGSKGIQEQLGLAEKYGATLSTKTVGGAKDMIAQQREMKIAMDGLKISIGTSLMPVLLAFSQILATITRVGQPLLRNTTVLTVLIAALAASFLLAKVAAFGAATGMFTLQASILLIPAAIALIAIAFIVAYQKVGWFRNAVNAVFNWIKTNWPLLLAIITGPIGIATLMIVRNFDKIKTAVTSTIGFFKRIPGAVKTAFNSAVTFIRGIPGRVKDVGRKIVSAIADGIRGATHILTDALASVVNSLPIPGFVKGKVKHALGLQHGGTVPTGGRLTVVGEAGPELLQLPGGATVTPLSAPTLPTPAIAGANTTAQFFLDRRLIATAVAQATSDQAARR